jgi:transcriptional regulator with XRE-family HTH domain
MKNKSLNREIGKRITELRTSRGIRRDKLADRLGITVSYLGLIERGERGLSISKCIILSDALYVSIDYITTGRGKSKGDINALPIAFNPFSPREKKLFSKFTTDYLLIPTEKRNADIIFENIRASLALYIKTIHFCTAKET